MINNKDEKCCGNCFYFSVDIDWEDCLDRKPGECQYPLPFFAQKAIYDYWVGKNIWNDKGQDCECFKRKQEK